MGSERIVQLSILSALALISVLSFGIDKQFIKSMFDTWSIVTNNFMFWLNYVVIICIALFLRFTKSDNYSLKELLIQIGATTFVLVTVYLTIFSTTTDLLKTEYWNGRVVSAVYEEKWTEEYDCSYTQCTGSGSNQVCVRVPQTCYTNHPDTYYIKTSNNTDLIIYEHNWKTYTKEFGAKETKMHRPSQTYSSRNRGEGDIWYSYPNTIIPVAETHKYNNYIEASKKTIHKNFQVQVSADDNKSLYAYPELKSNKYGNIEIDRVLGKEHLDFNTTNYLNTQLNLYNATVGKTKEVNILLYILKDKSRDYLDILKSKFKYNKNDAVIVLNIADNKITWSDTINFMGGEKFEVNTRTAFEDISILDGEKVVESIKNLINNSWERVPMKKFEYLKADISIDTKWEIIIVVLNLLLNGLLFWFFLKTKDTYRY